MNYTPTQIIDEIIQDILDIPQSAFMGDRGYTIDKLKKAKERILKECTIVMSTSDNTYNIPYGLVEEFEKDNAKFDEFQEETDSWYELCDKFDSKYSQYQV